MKMKTLYFLILSATLTLTSCKKGDFPGNTENLIGEWENRTEYTDHDPMYNDLSRFEEGWNLKFTKRRKFIITKNDEQVSKENFWLQKRDFEVDGQPVSALGLNCEWIYFYFSGDTLFLSHDNNLKSSTFTFVRSK